MSHGSSPLAAFHLVGDRSGLQAEPASPFEFRPALFGAYHDISSLRHDFPVVLLSEAASGNWIRSLSDIFDDLLRQISAPGVAGEETRCQMLSLEQAIRSLVSSGQKGSLSLFWEAGRRELVGGHDQPEPGSHADALNRTILQAREALGLDGELIDCIKTLASRLINRAWQESERWKAERLSARIERLAQKLSDILEADYMHSSEAREPQSLASSMGSGERNVFDFAKMADLLKSKPVADPMPADRKNRLQNAITILLSQRFVVLPGKGHSRQKDPWSFAFDDCHDALAAFRKRLPKMADLVKAISIAELEIENRYKPSRHDRFFETYDESRLGPADLAQFPGYLVCLENVTEAGQAAIFDVLRAGLPFKIVAQVDDILGDVNLADGQLSCGIRGQQLARMALGLDNVFVMQTAAASLYRLNESVLQGLVSDRPALFSVYAGNGYLDSAAATESRAFPCFIHDPAKGSTHASRFSLEGNPRPESDWPVHPFEFEGSEHDRKSENTAFTLIDFISCDQRFSGHFAPVHESGWDDEMVPASEFIELPAAHRAGKVPYVLLIDRDNRLHRAIADEKLVDAACRCRAAWRSLQESGGINNSYAAAALAEAQQAWNAEKQELTARASGSAAATESAGEPAPAPAPVQQAVPAEPIAAEDPEPSSDDAWIETIRCTTCNECTELNDRMFAYNEDMRAYVADPDAGSYRELVEAAETCQVAIIHPGKPRNPDEAGLEELLLRAEPFL